MRTQGISIAFLFLVVNLLISNAVFGSGLVLAQSDAATPGSADENRAKLIDMWQPGDPGERMNIRGRVTTIDRVPVAGARIFIRQADGEGDYTERYSTVLESDEKGRYQFGSVVPGNYYGVRHVHITVNSEGYGYFDSEILFKGDPNLDESMEQQAIFLEESNVKGETILFGRFDIVLNPN